MRDAAIDDDGLVDALIDGVGHALDLGQHTARNDARGLVTLDLGDLDLGDERRLVVLIVEQADNIRHADELFSVQRHGDLGGGGFTDPEKNVWKVEKSKRILDLAKELGTDVVTTHIGVVPEDENTDRFKIMQEACFELSRYADDIGAHFAIETGPEKSATLKKFLDSLGSTGVGVNLDPANLVMVTGDDPAGAVHNLKDYIVHTHAKDGKQNYYVDPDIIYGMVESHIVTADSFIEVPLGEGSVNWDEYLKALEDIGYKGFLTIEREVGDDPEKDIRKAVEFLNDKMGA